MLRVMVLVSGGGTNLQAIIDAGNDYQSFTGLAKDSKGSVKFIYKLEM